MKAVHLNRAVERARLEVEGECLDSGAWSLASLLSECAAAEGHGILICWGLVDVNEWVSRKMRGQVEV